ncbi:hypothetical protein VOLCADRAFT_92890 [Volvox carteri f. nagariensis]|uniref:Uncharacterized protein n=1 Tax=Volvox carteri f. nagariensis TaxID=3068 RepID=D8U0Q9_VOLCA|nr:uncharacterized protein VOLCADRAFT_92890 [Volvox carteri f. nagariensis]EFJ46682.1 hypothetical protein VOLCADRAFT_92890 [Volvox carteri f. nagariensis]|eukprot:XP_002952211.1 hypothetical protein VOLCADRAFT_92890 [Volvox carteri f. nagariensis]
MQPPLYSWEEVLAHRAKPATDNTESATAPDFSEIAFPWAASSKPSSMAKTRIIHDAELWGLKHADRFHVVASPCWWWRCYCCAPVAAEPLLHRWDSHRLPASGTAPSTERAPPPPPKKKRPPPVSSSPNRLGISLVSRPNYLQTAKSSLAQLRISEATSYPETPKSSLATSFAFRATVPRLQQYRKDPERLETDALRQKPTFSRLWSGAKEAFLAVTDVYSQCRPYLTILTEADGHGLLSLAALVHASFPSSANGTDCGCGSSPYSLVWGDDVQIGTSSSSHTAVVPLCSHARGLLSWLTIQMDPTRAAACYRVDSTAGTKPGSLGLTFRGGAYFTPFSPFAGNYPVGLPVPSLADAQPISPPPPRPPPSPPPPKSTRSPPFSIRNATAQAAVALPLSVCYSLREGDLVPLEPPESPYPPSPRPPRPRSPPPAVQTSQPPPQQPPPVRQRPPPFPVTAASVLPVGRADDAFDAITSTATRVIISPRPIALVAAASVTAATITDNAGYIRAYAPTAVAAAKTPPPEAALSASEAPLTQTTTPIHAAAAQATAAAAAATSGIQIWPQPVMWMRRASSTWTRKKFPFGLFHSNVCSCDAAPYVLRFGSEIIYRSVSYYTFRLYPKPCNESIVIDGEPVCNTIRSLLNKIAFRLEATSAPCFDNVTTSIERAANWRGVRFWNDTMSEPSAWIQARAGFTTSRRHIELYIYGLRGDWTQGTFMMAKCNQLGSFRNVCKRSDYGMCLYSFVDTPGHRFVTNCRTQGLTDSY